MGSTSQFAVQIVGFFADGSNVIHGFLDTNGTYTTIDGSAGIETVALSINSSGQIVGSTSDGHGGPPGFLYTSGIFTTITPIDQGSGINAAGQIVGDAGYNGFLYINGTLTPINVPGGNGATIATGINNAGQTVGWFGEPMWPGGSHGLLYNLNGTFTTFDVPGAGYYDQRGGSTQPQSINDAGQIVGYIYDADGLHGFLDTSGTFSIIDFPGTSGATSAYGINDAGQIAGSFSDGIHAHGFLYTPTETVASTPEPGSWWLVFGAGIVAIALKRRLKASRLPA